MINKEAFKPKAPERIKYNARGKAAGVLLALTAVAGLNALGESDEPKAVDTVEYTVEAGDTLTGIAKRFSADNSNILDNIHDLNEQRADKTVPLQPGDKFTAVMEENSPEYNRQLAESQTLDTFPVTPIDPDK